MLDLLRSADKFLPKFNGTSFFKHAKMQGEIDLEASLQGLGAIFNTQVYTIVLPSGYMDLALFTWKCILVALRTWG